MNNQAFHSPPLGFQPRNQLQSTPKFHQNNRFQRSPQPRSPGFNGHFPRNSSPYHAYHNQSKSFNSSTNSSPGEWNSRYNQSYSSNSSTSYFGDVSQLSPHYSPNRNNSSPYSQNRNKRFQGRRSFQSSDASDSNPGHSHDIRDYVQPSMLEDPWKDLMAEMGKKS